MNTNHPAVLWRAASQHATRTRPRRRRHLAPARQRGAVLIWLAIMLMALVGLIGLALDMGYATWTHHQMQVAADAASLAAARHVRSDAGQAREAAVVLAGHNIAARQAVALDPNEDNLAAGDVVLGWYDRISGTFTPDPDARNAVRVVARRTSDSHGAHPLLFGPMYGRPTMNLAAESIAMIGGGSGAGLIALDEDSPEAFYIHGSPHLDVRGGRMQINSSHDRAARLRGGVILDAPGMDIVGDVQFDGNAYTYDGEINRDAEPMDDPLAALEPPPIGEPNVPGGITESGTYGPGYYPDGINLEGGNVELEPGIYIVDGDGFQVGGNAELTAHGVMFYVKGTGRIRVDGTGDVIVTPPGPEGGNYEGISFFQERGNTNPIEITGTGFMSDPDHEGGAIYAPTARVELGGTGDMYINQLLAGQVHVYGSGKKTVMYRGDVPAAGQSVFLVK